MPTTATIRQVRQSERPWAYGKLSHFCGRFELDRRSGLWFAVSTPANELKRISAAFLLAPPLLRQLSWQHKLTVSTNWGKTARGHEATLYGDWPGKKPSEFSPHLEFGKNTLTSSLLAPHMVHELAHLWWNCLSLKERQAYLCALQATCSATTIEVTSYVQDKYNDWRYALAIKERFGASHRQSYLQHWLEESYAESVAALVVPGYAWKMSNVDLGRRRLMIGSITRLRHLKRISAAQIAALPALSETA